MTKFAKFSLYLGLINALLLSEICVLSIYLARQVLIGVVLSVVAGPQRVRK